MGDCVRGLARLGQGVSGWCSLGWRSLGWRRVHQCLFIDEIVWKRAVRVRTFDGTFTRSVPFETGLVAIRIGSGGDAVRYGSMAKQRPSVTSQ